MSSPFVPASPSSVLYCKTPVSSSESPGYFRHLLFIKDAKLKKLKQLLEEESNERNDLYQEYTTLKQEVETLRRETREKTTLIRQLNESIVSLESQQHEENEDEKTRLKNAIERKYKLEFNTLEQKFDQVLAERNDLQNWKDKNEARLKELAKDLHVKKIEICELTEIKQALTGTLEEQHHEINSLKASCNELREMVAQLNPQNNVSIEESFHGHLPEVTESLAVVVELQLQDKIEENEKLIHQIGNFKSALSQKDEAITCLKAEISELSQNIDHKSTEIQSLCTKSTELENSLSSKVEELEKAKKAIEKLIEDNSSNVAHLNEEISSLQINIEEMTAHRDSLRQNLDEKSTELETINSNHENVCASNKVLRLELETLKTTLNEKLKELSDCIGMNEKLENELTVLKIAHSQLEENKNQLFLQLTGKIAELQADLNNSKEQYDTLKQEFDGKCSELLSLSSSYKSEQDQNQNLAEELKELNGTTSGLRSELGKITDLYDNIKRDFDEKCAEALLLSSKYESEREQNHLLTEKLRETVSSLDAKLTELANANELSVKLEDKLNNLKKSYSEIEESKSKLMTQLNGDIEKLQNHTRELNAEIGSLKNKISEKTGELEALNSCHKVECAKNLELNESLKDLGTTLNMKSNELTECRDVIRKLEAELYNWQTSFTAQERDNLQITSNLKEEISKLCQNIGVMTSQNTALNEEISEKSEELQKMKYTILKLEEDNNQLLNNLQEEILVLENNVSVLTVENSTLKNDIDGKSSEVQNLKDTIMALEENKHQQMSASEEKISKLQNDVSQLTAENHSLNLNLGEKSKKLQELEDSKVKSDENNLIVTSLRDEILQLESDLSNLSAQNDSLKHTVDEKVAELQSLNLQYEDANSLSESLSKKLETLECALSDKSQNLVISEDIVHKLGAELENLKTANGELEKNKEQAVIKLNSEITKLQDDLNHLTKLNNTLKHAVEEKSAECQQLRLNYEKECDQNKCLNQKLKEIEFSLGEKLKELEDGKDITLRLEDELKNLRLAFSQLEESKNEAKTQLSRDIARLQTELQQLEQQNSLLVNENSKKQAELITLSSDCKNQCEQNQSLRKEVTELESNLSAKLTELDDTKEICLRLEEELTSLKFAHSHDEEIKNEMETSLNEKIAKLETNFDQIKEENNTLKQEIEAAHAELLSVSSSYQTERDQNQELNKKIIELEFSLGETFKELNSSKEILLKLEEENNRLNLVYSQSDENKNKEILRLSDEIAKLLSDLNTSVEQNNVLKHDIEEKHAELLTMSLNRESERDRNQRLNEKLNQLECSLSEKLKELDDSRETARKLEDELKDLKAKFMEFAENNNKVVTNMKGEFLKMETQVKELTKENNDLRVEIDKRSTELQNLSRSHEGEAAENAKTLDEIKALLDKNVEMREENAELKEAYNKLLDDFERHRTEMTESNEVLSKQVEEYREASNKYELKWKERMKQVKEDYEGQLAKIKQYMTKHYHDKMEKQEKEADEKLKVYKEKIAKDQECIKDLSSQIWNLSEKYLQAQQEIRNVTANNRRATISRLDLAKSPDGQLMRSMSVDHLRGGWEKEREKLIVKNDRNDIVDEFTYTRRRKLVPSGIGKKLSLQSGKVFPSEEDEDGEMFDAACLADLKEGRVRLSPDRNMRHESSRLSILQQRNSLCPPHLKSSYPAETQFLHPAQIREDDIKLGVGDNCSDTGSLVSNPDRKKKDAGQTLYKKPGPPTPSKHGGRSSHGGGPLPRSPAENKENVNTRVKHPSTPSKIMDFFRNKIRRDDRPPVAFSISPGPNPPTNRTRRSGFFAKKSERV